MEEQMQQLIVLLVLAAMQGDLKATLQLQQILQAAQQGDLLATQIWQAILQVMQQMQGQLALAAKRGALLQYIKRLRNQCADDEELQYFKVGGKVCSKCIKKVSKKEEGGSIDDRSEIIKEFEAFRCGGKMKNKKEEGGVLSEKCGGKTKKKEQGGIVSEKCGGKAKKS